MAYIGSSASPLPVNFSAVQAQGFNGTGSQTTFTLNRSVGSVAAVEVLVNNVQQSPYDGSYNITGGTSLVFSEAPSAGTNNVYVVYRDQAVGSLTDTGAVRKTGDTMTGALTANGFTSRMASFNQMSAEVTTDSQVGFKLARTGGTNLTSWEIYNNPADTTKSLRVYSEGADRLIIDSAGRLVVPNQPAFLAWSDLYSPTKNYTSEVVFNNANTNGLNVSTNVNGHFSSTTGAFTAPVAGRYFFAAGFSRSGGNATIDIYKNGSSTGVRHLSYGTDWQPASTSLVLTLAASDFVQLYFGGTNATTTSGYRIHFCGHMLG